MAGQFKDGAFGKFKHSREVASVDRQLIVRMNRDTIYSSGLFDLDAGPVTITLPDAGGRFLSALVINEDHYNPQVFYGAGTHTLTRQDVGTRYVMVAMRIFVDPNNPKGGDGAITVQFGDCSRETPNCLPVTRGWNYLVRLYRPRQEILNGTWSLPAAEPIQ